MNELITRLTQIPGNTVLFSVLGGILPALLWLWFWLREDNLAPEPKRVIIGTFLLGMLVVPLAIPFERYVVTMFGLDMATLDIKFLLLTNLPRALLLIALWAFIEELFKFLAAFIYAERSKSNDEPIDSVIYLITAALGFAALENTLYILNYLIAAYSDHGSTGAGLLALVFGNSRFIGASLLHILSSGIVGVCLSFSFYKNKTYKVVDLVLGLILATLLHSFFNLFIMNGTSNSVFVAFAFVWVGVIFLILLFEKVKKIKNIPTTLLGEPPKAVDQKV